MTAQTATALSAAAQTAISSTVIEDVPLLASVIGGDLEGFADTIVGALQRLLRETKVKNLSSDAVAQVIRALLEYVYGHSNRVWTSVPRIAAVAGIGQRTVRRALEWLRANGILRDVVGEELYLGRGAHEWPKALRKSEKALDSNCYDLSGLIILIPATLRKLINAALAGNLRAVAGIIPVPPLPEVEDVFTDPFADPPVTEVSPLLAEPIAQHVPDSADPSSPLPVKTRQAHTSTFSDPNPAIQCLVSPINSPGAEQNQAGKQADAVSRIARPEMASTYSIEDAAPPKNPLKPGFQRLAPGPENDAYQGLLKEKVSPKGATEILADKGPRWTLTLLAYGRWTKRKHAIGPGWYVAIAKNPDGWPDDFLEWYGKEKSKQRVPAATKPKPRTPAPVPTPQRFIAPSLAANKAALDALPPAEWTALEKQAKEQLSSELKDTPKPPIIRARMLALLKLKG